MNQIVRDIRSMGPSENGSYPLITADDQNIEFYSDYDRDGIVEKVRYSIEGQNLIKAIVEPSGSPAVYDEATERTRIVTGNVKNDSLALFTYFNKDWPQDTTTNPLSTEQRIADTRIIRLTLSINANANRPNQIYHLQSYVNIRSLKDNL